MLRPALLAKMQRYSWPGNVRQLENLIKRYVVMGTDDVILSELLQSNERDALPDLAFDGPVSLKKLTRQTVRKIEARIILSALHANNWNRKKAARALGISYRALLYKLKEVGVPQRRATATRDAERRRQGGVNLLSQSKGDSNARAEKRSGKPRSTKDAEVDTAAHNFVQLGRGARHRWHDPAQCSKGGSRRLRSIILPSRPRAFVPTLTSLAQRI